MTGNPLAPRVRRRRDADLDGCARALRAVHEHDGYPVEWPADPVAWLRPPQLLAAWVAGTGTGVAGHAALTRGGPGDAAAEAWGAYGGADPAATALVGRLFVDPAARGAGLGALLLDQAVREARRVGLHPVLDVVSTDTAAVALYERLGWIRTASADQVWGSGRTVTVRCYAAPAG
ncbi:MULTISPECIES: GNAT family N-acetyltransferase [Streptomycetaceae]|nr:MULTISPECIES: GNAT family N-acetyltransferase [Streptomycetaceae]